MCPKPKKEQKIFYTRSFRFLERFSKTLEFKSGAERLKDIPIFEFLKNVLLFLFLYFFKFSFQKVFNDFKRHRIHGRFASSALQWSFFLFRDITIWSRSWFSEHFRHMRGNGAPRPLRWLKMWLRSCESWWSALRSAFLFARAPNDYFLHARTFEVPSPACNANNPICWVLTVWYICNMIFMIRRWYLSEVEIIFVWSGDYICIHPKKQSFWRFYLRKFFGFSAKF